MPTVDGSPNEEPGKAFDDSDERQLSTRDNDSQTSVSTRDFIKSWHWWIFLFLTVGAEALGLLAYNMTPALIIAPLGSLSIIATLIGSWYQFGEKLTQTKRNGIVLALFGCIIIVVNTKPTA